MRIIINTLNTFNNYIAYLYIVIFIVVAIMLVMVLLAMIKLSHSITDFTVAIDTINQSYNNLNNYKKKTSSFYSKTLKVLAAYELARIYLSGDKRAELRKEKEDITLTSQRDKYVKRLLKD